MPEIVPQPAPAAPAAPAEPIKTADFLASRRAEIRGETPAPVEPAEPVAPAEPAPAPPVRRSEPTPQDRRADDRITRRVSEAVAPLQAEIANLRAQLAGRREPEPAKPAESAAPAWKKYREHPDAPKLADFDSIEDHAAAMAHFVGSELQRETQEATARASRETELTETQRQRADGFAGRIREATTADAAFWDAVSPEVQALKPFDALQPGEPSGPQNVVAEEVLSSPVGPQLMRKLSEPGTLQRLCALPEHLKSLPRARVATEHARWIVREIGKLEATLAQPPAPAAAPPKLVSDAPEPAERLGRRPAAPVDAAQAALARKDTGGYLAARRAELAATVRR